MKKSRSESSPFDKLIQGARATKVILSSNSFIKTEDIHSEKDHFSDEELYYIALSVGEMKTVRLKRSIFDMVHLQCDEDSVERFMSYFSEENKREIMLSC